MLEVKIFDLGYCDEMEYTRVVCVCKYNNKYVFSYNKKRKGWEIPGGHIEPGEDWITAARRELYEEAGVINANIEAICLYKITTFGLLCYCDIIEMTELPKEYEMSKIMLSDSLPENLTYPDTL